MNARDNLKPKSIRVAILQALADGAITTIDDLQIKMDEKREKIANNVYPAAAEGLIKRMRDDVTGGAAYQILPKGRELLAKYASGKFEAPADVVEMREIPAPEVSRRKSEAVAVEVLETAMPGFTAAVVAQKDEEIARLNGAIKAAQGHIETLNGTIAQLGKEKAAYSTAIDRLSSDFEKARSVIALWQSMASLFGCDTPEQVADRISGLDERVATFNEPIVAGYVIQRAAKPLVRFTKAISAETRAMAFARTGQRAQVFALHLVGTAVPGAEWRKA